MGLDPELLKQLIQTFKAELEEQTQIITNGLLELEKGIGKKEDREKTITAIFRAAHNIKGSSRSLGIHHVGNIAHNIESLFSSIQKKEMDVQPPLIDLCLEAVDKMQSAMESFLKQTPLDFDIDDLIMRLNQGQQGEKVKKPESPKVQEHPIEQPREELKSQQNSIRVSIDNIDHISSLMEEMQVNKIAIDDHYTELAKLLIKIKQFQDVWKQILYF
ncbi:MAG: chemotaxis protein CheA, partial [Gammaproteobacteria bacterium]